MKALHHFQLTSRRVCVEGKSCAAWGLEPDGASVTSLEKVMR